MKRSLRKAVDRVLARLVERAAVVRWLRNAENPGGDTYVARTLADAIERGEHLQ